MTDSSSPDSRTAQTTNALVTQLTTGPSMREVAAKTLRPALKALYPQLDIDPDLAIVVSPSWRVVEGQVTPGAPRYEHLSSVLALQANAYTPVVYIDGEHYLTYRNTNSGPDIHLPVRIDDIARMINEFAPLLFIALQEQQLDYWNYPADPTGPRWKTFANTLRGAWGLQGDDWDEHEQAIARLVFQYPDHALRLPNDKYRTRTYLIDVDVNRDNRIKHLGYASYSVLIGTHEKRAIILAYSIATGHKRFDSLQDLGETLNRHAVTVQGHPLHWRLFEPEGDFFEFQACMLISQQIDALTEIDFSERTPPSADDPEQQDLTLEFNQISVANQSKLQLIRDVMPDWLKSASFADGSLYSRYLLDLAMLNDSQANKTYLDGIAPIRDYALQALQEAMLTDHPRSTNLNVQNIRVTITSQVVLGLFTAPGLVDTQTFALVDMALENLIALPLGNKTVYYENGGDVPEWMTADYLESLITQVDVGKHYPALIKRTLLDKPTESLRRQTLYANQLRLQLPLLALQYKILNQFGVDELGYRYVCALMKTDPDQRRVDGQAIVIRPLAFIPSRRLTQTADTVANMFVIGPQDAQAGPCLLYRPLSNMPLLQFASHTNLLYAIKQDTSLRQAVLAWLPDSSRFSYAQFVFPGSLSSPWVLSKLLIEPLTAVVMSGPIALGDGAVGGDYMAALFKSNANALVTLADQQSVSNAEGRWESFKQAGWLVFNAALPFLGKTVGTAAWIRQLVDDLEQAIEANERGDVEAKWSAVTDIILNLGMALALHVADRHKPPVARPARKPPVDEEKTTPPTPARAPTIIQKPDIEIAQLPIGHEPSLHTLGTLTRNPPSLKKTLDSFSVAKPEGLGAQHAQAGAYQHLYPLQEHWYAPVAQQWFEVVVDENDAVIIVDPKQPTRLGPVLINNRLGQWFIDTRLRLRGGGFRSRLKGRQRLRPPKINELREQLDAFDDQREQKLAELMAARNASLAAPSASAEAKRAEYTNKLQKRREEYEIPIAQLKSLNILDTVPDYPERMIHYLKHQVLLTRATIDVVRDDFQQQLDDIGPHLNDESPTIDLHQRVDATTVQMVQQLEYMHARFKDLQGLGANGLAFVEDTRLHMPGTRLNDLKAFRISLARYCALKTGNAAARSGARQALNRIVESADLAVQSLEEVQQLQETAPLNERVEVLDSLVDQFATINQDLLDLPDEYPREVLIEHLEDVRQLIDEFAQRATRQLVSALRERKSLEPKPQASGSSQAPRRKIIKTRYKGMVVGEPRPHESGLVDVTEPLTHKVIATFHEKTPGVWLRREPPRQEASRKPPPGLSASMKSGRELLADVDGFIERTKVQARKKQRLPVEIEEKVQRQAKKLEEASATIEHAANATNQTDNTTSEALRQQLGVAVKKLYDEGRRIKLDMLKTRPPTAAHVQLLHQAKEVTIAISGSRRRLKGPRKDYLQEYEIRDKKTKRVLWYAHFHYQAPKSGDELYSAAHLKTPEQRRLGGAFVERGVTSEQAGIAVYRSEIGPHLAQLLFLGKPTEPEASTSTLGASASVPS
jgi:hypothetical protein